MSTLRLALERAGFAPIPTVQQPSAIVMPPADDADIQFSKHAIGRVANYLTRGGAYDTAHIDTARQIAMKALRESALECGEGCSKDQRISNAVRHIRRNMLRNNPQDDRHRLKLARELISRWHQAQAKA